MKSTDSQRMLNLFTWLKWVLALMQWLCVFASVIIGIKVAQTGNFAFLLFSVAFSYLVFRFYMLGNLFIMDVLVQQRQELEALKQIWLDIRKKNQFISKLYFKAQARKLIK